MDPSRTNSTLVSTYSVMVSERLVEIWKRETEAALAATQTGAITHLWKVAGQRTVLAVVELPAADDLDRGSWWVADHSRDGCAVRTEAWPIYDYGP